MVYMLIYRILHKLKTETIQVSVNKFGKKVLTTINHTSYRTFLSITEPLINYYRLLILQ